MHMCVCLSLTVLATLTGKICAGGPDAKLEQGWDKQQSAGMPSRTATADKLAELMQAIVSYPQLDF